MRVARGAGPPARRGGASPHATWHCRHRARGSRALVALPPLTVRTLVGPIVFGALAGVLGVGAITRGEKRVGWGAASPGSWVWSAVSSRSRRAPRTSRTSSRGRRSFRSPRLDDTADVRGDRRPVSERSGVVNIGLEGMMLMGAFFGIWGADVTGWWFGGLVIGMIAGGLSRSSRGVLDPPARRPDRRAAPQSSSSPTASPATCTTHYGFEGTPNDLPRSRSQPDFLDDSPEWSATSCRTLSATHLLTIAILIVRRLARHFQDTNRTPHPIMGEHPRAADTVGINVYRSATVRDRFRHACAWVGRTFRSALSTRSTDKMTAGLGFIALAALIFGNWRPSVLLSHVFSSASRPLSASFRIFDLGRLRLFEAFRTC